MSFMVQFLGQLYFITDTIASTRLLRLLARPESRAFGLNLWIQMELCTELGFKVGPRLRELERARRRDYLNLGAHLIAHLCR